MHIHRHSKTYYDNSKYLINPTNLQSVDNNPIRYSQDMQYMDKPLNNLNNIGKADNKNASPNNYKKHNYNLSEKKQYNNIESQPLREKINLNNNVNINQHKEQIRGNIFSFNGNREKVIEEIHLQMPEDKNIFFHSLSKPKNPNNNNNNDNGIYYTNQSNKQYCSNYQSSSVKSNPTIDDTIFKNISSYKSQTKQDRLAEKENEIEENNLEFTLNNKNNKLILDQVASSDTQTNINILKGQSISGDQFSSINFNPKISINQSSSLNLSSNQESKNNEKGLGISQILNNSVLMDSKNIPELFQGKISDEFRFKNSTPVFNNLSFINGSIIYNQENLIVNGFSFNNISEIQKPSNNLNNSLNKDEHKNQKSSSLTNSQQKKLIKDELELNNFDKNSGDYNQFSFYNNANKNHIDSNKYNQIKVFKNSSSNLSNCMTNNPLISISTAKDNKNMINSRQNIDIVYNKVKSRSPKDKQVTLEMNQYGSIKRTKTVMNSNHKSNSQIQSEKKVTRVVTKLKDLCIKVKDFDEISKISSDGMENIDSLSEKDVPPIIQETKSQLAFRDRGFGHQNITNFTSLEKQGHFNGLDNKNSKTKDKSRDNFNSQNKNYHHKTRSEVMFQKSEKEIPNRPLNHNTKEDYYNQEDIQNFLSQSSLESDKKDSIYQTFCLNCEQNLFVKNIFIHIEHCLTISKNLLQTTLEHIFKPEEEFYNELENINKKLSILANLFAHKINILKTAFEDKLLPNKKKIIELVELTLEKIEQIKDNFIDKKKLEDDLQLIEETSIFLKYNIDPTISSILLVYFDYCLDLARHKTNLMVYESTENPSRDKYHIFKAKNRERDCNLENKISKRPLISRHGRHKSANEKFETIIIEDYSTANTSKLNNTGPVNFDTSTMLATFESNRHTGNPKVFSSPDKDISITRKFSNSNNSKKLTIFGTTKPIIENHNSNSQMIFEPRETYNNKPPKRISQ